MNSMSVYFSNRDEKMHVRWQCEKLRAEAATLPGIRAELESLRRRHSAALELMGERDEEVYKAFVSSYLGLVARNCWNLSQFQCYLIVVL